MKELRCLKTNNLITIIGLLMMACNQQNSNERKIAFLGKESFHFNLGTVETDSVYNFDLFVKPIGTEPLVIDSVSTNCECTNVIFLHNTIKIGDSAKFTVTYKPGKSDTSFFSSGFIVQANIKNYFVPISFSGTFVNK
jgi:hypothetical protein